MLPCSEENMALSVPALTVSLPVSIPVQNVIIWGYLDHELFPFAAAAYYTSFASVGIVIYLIRTRQGYRSLPEAINERYGSMATLAFGLAVLFRLYQEVWSNALVVAGFYGDEVQRFFLCS